MKRLYVLYDGGCGLCCRAVSRLASEPAYLELRFAPAGAFWVRERFAAALGQEPRQVVVVADTGEIYRGPSAWIMVLYALRRWRPLAVRLASPGWRPWVDRAVDLIGRNRHSLSSVFGWTPEGEVLQSVRRTDGASGAGCTQGGCGLGGSMPGAGNSPDTAARLLEAKARVARAMDAPAPSNVNA